jgi:hypothetical protein
LVGVCVMPYFQLTRLSQAACAFTFGAANLFVCSFVSFFFVHCSCRMRIDGDLVCMCYLASHALFNNFKKTKTVPPLSRARARSPKNAWMAQRLSAAWHFNAHTPSGSSLCLLWSACCSCSASGAAVAVRRKTRLLSLVANSQVGVGKLKLFMWRQILLARSNIALVVKRL